MGVYDHNRKTKIHADVLLLPLYQSALPAFSWAWLHPHHMPPHGDVKKTWSIVELSQRFRQCPTYPLSLPALHCLPLFVFCTMMCRYSPLLCFDVPDMDHAVQRALGMGGHLDGPIKYPAHGAVASIRSPDGHMVGLFQPDDQEGL